MEKYSWFKTEWHEAFNKSMQVNGLGERSRQAYTRAMRMLAEHCDKTPDHISEEELLDYFIHRQEVSRWSPATMRICHAGIKFFFKHVLKKDWHILQLAKAKREQRLPAVLSQEEVKRIMGKVSTFHNYAYLMTVYTCGCFGSA